MPMSPKASPRHEAQGTCGHSRPAQGFRRRRHALAQRPPRVREANERDFEAWSKIREGRDRLGEVPRRHRSALKRSLGDLPEPTKQMKTVVTRTIEGEGYKIENTLFESRPGLWVTANLYLPAKPRASPCRAS